MANQTNIISDLSVLTRAPNKLLNEFNHKLILCIGSAIADAKRNNETAAVINIGIGTLSVDLIEMQCKFLPSRELKATIKNCIEEPIDPLDLALEASLVEKLSKFVEEVL